MKSKLAIWCLILAILGIINFATFWLMFTTPIFSVPSIILGIIGLTRIKKYNLEGKGIAITGVVLSSLIMILWVLDLSKSFIY